MITAKDIQKLIENEGSKEQATVFQRFFKTGPGQYGEGDIFVGINVPTSRKIAKEGKDLPLEEVQILLSNPIHESRLIALVILVEQFKKGDEQKKKAIYDFYLKNTNYINNWDLVDVSAHYIVGAYLFEQKDSSILDKLAKSENMWERRIAMIATFYYIYQRQSEPTFRISEALMYDKEDLLHKAMGWMLREVGKKCGEKELLGFLDKYAKRMPRTALRYSLEKLTPEQKKHYMNRDS